MPNKRSPSSNIYLKKSFTSDSFEVFQIFYSNLADNLVKKLPALVTIEVYYKNIHNFSQLNHFILERLKNLGINKAASNDNISGKLLKDDANISGIPITQANICLLSRYFTFLTTAK